MEDMITVRQIRQLRAKAMARGELDTVELCDKAIDGDLNATAFCALMIGHGENND